MANQPISVYLPVVLKARLPEVVTYYGATTPGKLFKGLLEEAIHNMEVASLPPFVKAEPMHLPKEARDRLLTLESR